MKNYQYYRDLGLIKVHHDGSYECLLCEMDIIAPSGHFRKYHPEYYADPSLIKDIRSVKVGIVH
jgi:hypothetical protein